MRTIAKNTQKLEERVSQIASGTVAVFVIATILYFVVRTIVEKL